ncbi:hypothetical protein MTO96_010029 [Rhipicephalus appendiculatus]
MTVDEAWKPLLRCCRRTLDAPKWLAPAAAVDITTVLLRREPPNEQLRLVNVRLACSAKGEQQVIISCRRSTCTHMKDALK